MTKFCHTVERWKDRSKLDGLGSIYRTHAIITHGLYTFYPLFEVHLSCHTHICNIYEIADRFCGSILSCNHGDTANRGVLTSAKPFGFRVYFNNAGDDNSGDRGFALNYRQEMC